MSPGPHYVLGEEEERVEGTKEEEEEEEGPEYATNTPSGGSYMTPPTLGARGPEASDYMLRTLRALVE